MVRDAQTGKYRRTRLFVLTLAAWLDRNFAVRLTNVRHLQIFTISLFDPRRSRWMHPGVRCRALPRCCYSKVVPRLDRVQNPRPSAPLAPTSPVWVLTGIPPALLTSIPPRVPSCVTT